MSHLKANPQRGSHFRVNCAQMYTHETIDTVRLYPAWVSWLAAIAAFLLGLASVVGMAGGTVPILVGVLGAFGAFDLARHLVRQTRIRTSTYLQNTGIEFPRGGNDH